MDIVKFGSEWVGFGILNCLLGAWLAGVGLILRWLGVIS